MVVLPTSLVDPRGGVGETVGGATLQPRCVACAGWRRDRIRDLPCPLDDREAATRGPSTVLNRREARCGRVQRVEGPAVAALRGRRARGRSAGAGSAPGAAAA